ncbi:ABC transporter [Candidatus Curtissbacteria bacterium RBG_16_39_7]|uniref:ABC transporter n=1 Tax=Candidatus Curtissbacteria bacterium RBG_16_39_7 TaxID=1797707 RepID=A0A1F5G200_9BACT|nr:MAG: ABC transporter [Candidatus Curtissbacteria bacterium RBG_16_39_7]
MPTISVEHLAKYYRVYQKTPGVLGTLKALFSRKYYDVKAVDDVSFSIDEGELVGCIGPNGAGKTTTLKILSGLLYPTKGKVSVLGFVPWERKENFQKQLALVMGQKNQLWWDLPAIESFVLNKEIYEVPDQKYKKIMGELTEMLDIKDLLNVQVKKLSLGERMKAELVAALLHEPKILFLDEPTIGLDVVAQKKMRDFIKNYREKYKATIILTSHYMGDVKELCQRVIIIDLGRIVFDGKLDELVARYADHKVITCLFERPVDRENLEGFGKIDSFEPLKVSIQVERPQVSQVSGELLSNFPIADLTIEEPPIEEIIRTFFAAQNSS